MKRMREIWAIDGERGWMVRFSVSDGQTQFDVDYVIARPEDYAKAREAAVTALRAPMAEHMMTEDDLIDLPVPKPNLRPDWLNALDKVQ